MTIRRIERERDIIYTRTPRHRRIKINQEKLFCTPLRFHRKRIDIEKLLSSNRIDYCRCFGVLIPRRVELEFDQQWKVIRGNVGIRTADDFIGLNPVRIERTQNAEHTHQLHGVKDIINNPFEIIPRRKKRILDWPNAAHLRKVCVGHDRFGGCFVGWL